MTLILFLMMHYNLPLYHGNPVNGLISVPLMVEYNILQYFTHIKDLLISSKTESCALVKCSSWDTRIGKHHTRDKKIYILAGAKDNQTTIKKKKKERKYRHSLTSSSSKDSACTPVPPFAEAIADETFFSSLPPLGLLLLTWGRVVVSVDSAPSNTKVCSSTRGLRLAHFIGIRLSRRRSPGSSGLEDWPANEG